MNPIEVTYEQILQFRRGQEQYTAQRPGKFSPFLYAASKMHKRLKEHEDEYNDRFQELNLEYCAKDKHGFAEMEKFTRERRGEKSEDERFKFTIENQKTVNEKKRDLLNTKVEIEPYITEDVPEDFGFDWWNIFAPFILPQDPSEEQLEKLYKMADEKEEERKKARELREQR